MTVLAVLGTGYMGAPMARNLRSAGFGVRVWNRTIERAEPLAGDGATVATWPADAVDGADIVITMLADGPAVDEVMRAAASKLSSRAVWLQMATVGVAWVTRLADLADEVGVAFVDAPVLGTRKPAQDGTLTVLAAAASDVRDTVQPVFDAVGSQTIWLDRPGDASRLKLVANTWIASLTVALAESLALADGLGVDPHQFLDAIDGGPVGAPYAQIKGMLMLADDYPASFPVKLARKDTGLILEAARDAGLHLSVATAVAQRFADADEAGHGDADMAAVRRVV